MASTFFRRFVYPTVCVLALGLSQVSNAAPPTTPGDFSYTVYSDSAAELFWLRSINVAVQGYELKRNGETLGIFDALSYFDDTLIPGIEYTYSISAVGVDGERSGTSIVTLRTPPTADTIASLQSEVSTLEQEVQSLQSLLNSGIPSPVPQTGQRVSEQFGDDGDYQAGIAWPDPRFTINVNEADDVNENGVCDDSETCNGSITDNLTGLVWLQNANCFGERTWEDGINEANNLAGDGFSNCGLTDNSQIGDWRMPNIKELQSLMDYGHAFPTLLLPEGHPFVDVQVGGISSPPSEYWTSTSTGAGNDGAYTVSISVGWVQRYVASIASTRFYVWPVSGGY